MHYLPRVKRLDPESRLRSSGQSRLWERGPSVPVLSEAHGTIKHAASTRRVGSHRGSLGRSARPGPGLIPSPPTQRHFTRADQVNQLIGASEADPDLGFMARTMALCSLPRTNPGNHLQYKRQNGPFTLYMVAGGGNKLPFGNFPRLLLAWVSTEAVRTQSRELVLGRSLSEFMRALGVYSSSGGRGGVQTRLRNQMNRLFGCTVSLIYEDENGRATVNSLIADRTELWWTSNRPDQAGLWESKIELSEKFFQEIIRHPVPIDINTLTALKRSTLGLDLYLWLWSTAPLPSALRYGSPGGRFTASSEHTRTTPTTRKPFKTSASRCCAS